MYGMVSANLENCAGQRKYTFHEKSAVRTRSAIFHWFSGDTAPYKKYVSTGVGSPFPPCTLYICTYTAVLHSAHAYDHANPLETSSVHIKNITRASPRHTHMADFSGKLHSLNTLYRMHGPEDEITQKKALHPR